jgi:hypothetical protein
MENKKLTENDKQVIKLLTWAYRQGFEAAERALNEHSKQLNQDKMEDRFAEILFQEKEKEK